jgi:geranylgeranyl pyrophosphate synthase
LVVGEGLGASRQTLMPAALAVEILHTFTLVHDDIMDNDTVRRGQQTVHVKWDVNTAILAGDGLMALAFRTLMQTKSAHTDRIGTTFSQAMLEICEGQSFDMDFEKNNLVEVPEYMDMVLRKTGCLLGLACHLGALIADASPKIAENLKLFGREIGQAFQIQDDLLELTANQETMGKSLGSDLAAGKKTYPIVAALSNMPETERADFLGFLKANSANRRLIVQELNQHGCIQQTEAVIARLFANAAQRLRVLPDDLQVDLQYLIRIISGRQS